MPVSYGKGARGKATKLHSELVRMRGKCEACGRRVGLQCAHIVSRRYALTRTDLDNAFCLCARCHRHFTDWPMEFAEFVHTKIGLDAYLALKLRANSLQRVDWDAELARLKDIEQRGAWQPWWWKELVV